MSELTDLRTKTTRTFDEGGGSLRLECGYTHALKGGVYVDAAGLWVDGEGVDEDGDAFDFSNDTTAHDLDIKTKKNAPLDIKIKDLITGKKFKMEPKQANNKPEYAVNGDTVSVSQAWDGIDVEMTMIPTGIKMKYTITSTDGQREIEWKMKDDLGWLKIQNPWYETPSGRRDLVPMSVVGNDLTVDLTGVPVGAVVDPTLETTEDEAGIVRNSQTTGSYTWSQIVSDTDGTSVSASTAGFSLYYVSTESGSWYCDRSYMNFDTSSLGTGVTVTAASLTLTAITVSYSGNFDVSFYEGNWAIVPGTADFDSFVAGKISADLDTTGWASGGSKTVTITDLAAINKSGDTKIMARNTDKDVNDVAPTTYNFLTVYDKNAGDSAYRPKLSVTYSPSGGPFPHHVSRRLKGGFPEGVL